MPAGVWRRGEAPSSGDGKYRSESTGDNFGGLSISSSHLSWPWFLERAKVVITREVQHGLAGSGLDRGLAYKTVQQLQGTQRSGSCNERARSRHRRERLKRSAAS